jgi:hypothetical protein
MIARRYCRILFTVLAALSVRSLCLAQGGCTQKPDKITKVAVLGKGSDKVTQLEIELQCAPDNMEPAAEPRSIRIEDRASVRFLLKNLSPLDVCTRTASPPSATQETPVAESFVTTIAGLGAQAIGLSTAKLAVNSPKSAQFALENHSQLNTLLLQLSAPPSTQCKVQKDPEYKQILDFSKSFFTAASALIGIAKQDGKCNNPADQADQSELTCEIDSATRQLAAYAGADYRGTAQVNFIVDGNATLNIPPDPKLQPVRDAYSLPLKSIETAGKIQAMVDEMAAWAADLHKKYDFIVPPHDTSSPAGAPPIPGVLTVAPATVSITPAALTQPVQLSSGGQAGTFTAIPSSDTGWLRLSKAGGSPSTAPFKDTAPASGTFALLVTVDPTGLDDTTHYGAITITGTGAAKGTTIVNVTFKKGDTVAQPSQCDLGALHAVDEIVDRAKAEMSITSDVNKALEAAQTSLKTSYMALVKVADDFRRRQDQKIVYVEHGVLVQPFSLGTDRKDTSPGYFSCVSDIDGKTPTTTNINYSLLYQDIPHWSASAGLLVSFQQKKIIGIANENTPGSSPPANMQVFGVTDQARVQVIPMAYANYRIGYHLSHYGKGKEDEGIWTTHLSGGLGVNPNSGTNQPEFFTGFAIGFNHFMVHPGVHWGRTESLGGGYTLGTMVPATLMTAPLSWSYHPAFSIGFSVRVAPY